MSTSGFLSDRTRTKLIWSAGVALAILLVGSLFAPERVWSNLFVATFYLLTLALGGTVFIALAYVSGAGWNVAFRRVPEALAALIPVMGLAALAVVALRLRHYGWQHHGAGDAGTFWFKQLWLTPSFWLLRSIFYVIVWTLLSAWLLRRSRRINASDKAASEHVALFGNVRISAVFLVVYALTFSLASVDWIMALDPMWFSTMWGVYNFAGMFLATLATVTILCVFLSAGPGRPLHQTFSTEHLHDLGRLTVGFSCFWMYIWFSQYMLIWYSNIPEETSYFITRTHGPWGPVVVVSLVLNWLLPFFILLPRPAKRSATVMTRVAVVLLVGRWVDLYLMVFPSTVGDAPVFGVWEIAGIAGIGAVTLVLADRSFRTSDSIPNDDPYLAESLQYHA